ASVVATVDGASSAPLMVTLAAAWPSVFPHGVFNQDNSENTAATGAKPGDILQIFATGIPKSAVVTAQIGGRKDLAPVYAGDAPGFAGVQQVNVALPEGLGAATTLILCATTPGGQQFCSDAYSLVV